MKIENKLILLQQDKTDWRTALKISAEKLLKENYIEQRYIDALINSVETLGPYIVIAPNLAIPHARPEDGAIKMGLSLTTFKEPIFFKTEADNRYSARVFITISAIDYNSHLEMLKSLASKLSEKTIEKLSKAKTIVEIKNILS